MSRRAIKSGKRRWGAASITAIAIIALVVPIAPAYADDPPPLVWGTAASATVDGAVVSIESALSDYDPFEGRESLDPVAVQRAKVVNNSDRARTFGVGIDIAVQGQIDRLWTPEAWGQFADDGLEGYFTFTVEPDQTAYFFEDGLPGYPGRTGVIYELSESVPDPDADPPAEPGPVVTEVVRHKTPGGFVSVRLDEATDTWLPRIGSEMTVVGVGEQPELFPGVTGTIQAAGLPANRALELWLAPNFDYLWFHVLGANLPADARLVGSTTTAADGTLQATFTVPSDVPVGPNQTYQLLAGVRADHYWPGGTYDGFVVTTPTTTGQQAASPTATSASIGLGLGTNVQFTFPAGTGGTWTATQSLTGPVPNEFQMAGSGTTQVFYHLDTTATLSAPIEVCISYSTASLPGAPPRLYHYALTPEPARWYDITTRSEPGLVCGATSSFSPFALGYPLDDGSRAKPAVGVLESDNGWDNGIQDGSYNINMNMWWGENARIVRLRENGVVIGEKTLIRNTPNAQKAVFPISGRVNGSYVYTAELENSRGVTVTKAITVKVTEANPAKPVLSATSPQNGAFTVTANLWWGTNATSYRFVENGTVVGTGSLTSATPNAQAATLQRTGKAKGTYSYVVEFTNAAGTTSSAVLKVTVK